MNYLVVDYGTSGCRASFVNEFGKISASCRKPVSVDCRGNAAEIDLDKAWASTVTVIRELLDKTGYPEIDAVGVSSLLGWVFLDSSGNPLINSLIWMDSRSGSELESAIEPDKKLIYRKTGRRLSRELLVSKWSWLMENSPVVVKKAARVISMKDELVRRMTGEIITDFAHLNYTMLWNIHENAVDPQMLELADFPQELLARGDYPFREAGRLTSGASAATGLKQGLPVIIGSIDGTTAMYGGGMAAGKTAVLVSGTTDVAMTLVGNKEVNLFRDRDVLTINTGMVPGTFAVGGSTGMSGGALSRMTDLLQGGYRQLVESAGSVPPGAEGLLFCPGLTGERAPYWNAGAAAGLYGLRMEHTPAHIIRSVMEGAAFRLKRLFSEMFEETGYPDGIYTVGGYAEIDLWNRIKADVCNLILRRPAELEATTIGTAMFCDCFIRNTEDLESVSKRWIKSEVEYPVNENNYKIYAEQFPRYERFVEGQIYG